MIRSTHKLYSLNRFTLTGVTDSTGVLYTNAIQGSTPAADGTLSLYDQNGALLNSGAMTYAGASTWTYDAPAALFTPDVLLTARAALTNHADGTTLHTESVVYEPPAVAGATFRPLSLNPYTLSGSDPSGTAYTSATASATLTITDRTSGFVYLNAAAMTPAAGNTWTHPGAQPAVYDPGRILRIMGQVWNLAGSTLYDTELADWWPG